MLFVILDLLIWFFSLLCSYFARIDWCFAVIMQVQVLPWLLFNFLAWCLFAWVSIRLLFILHFSLIVSCAWFAKDFKLVFVQSLVTMDILML